MSLAPSAGIGVAEVTTYLADAGWRRRLEGWRGAAIWGHPNGAEVLVPPRDGMGDADLRLRDILAILAEVEQRPVADIAQDIGSPLVDTQSYRTFPDGLPRGTTTLPAGLQALQGVRDIFGAAARTVLEGPHFAFTGQRPRTVTDLLDRVQLGPTRPGSYLLTVRVPVDEPDWIGEPIVPFGRQVLLQIHDAVTAVAPAAESSELAAFDSTVTAGVSAELCEALSGLSGTQRRQPFEISFRWARGLRSELPPATVRLPEGAGVVLRAAAARLRQLHVSGEATVTGTVEDLHDDPPGGGDRWRIKVRGELRSEGGVARRRAIWVRLPDQDAYDAAIAAHGEHRPVRAAGVLTSTNGRVELVARRDGLEELA